MDEIIRCKDLNFYYKVGGQINSVLKEISLTIEKGSFVSILGRNGSGKSTLAKHFNAILLPKEGEVIVAGINSKMKEKKAELRGHVGMVFQNPDNQIVASTVKEDIEFGLENIGLDKEKIESRIDETLNAIEMMSYKNWAISRLSGGEKQRIALAGILAMRPDCIVLDEPTAMLDPRGRKEVMEAIQELRKKFGITIILITHFMDEAVMSDRVIVIDEGDIILDGSPKSVFSHVEKIKAVGLDVPQSVELLSLLRESGINISIEGISTDDCAEMIVKLLRDESYGEN